MPYETPRGRRLNVLALTTRRGDAAELHWMTSRRHLDLDDLLHLLRALPPAPVPTVVVLDNAGLHRSHAVRAARADLRARWIYIERLFRTVKHHDLPERTYPTFDALEDAVVSACERQEAHLLTKPSSQPRQAA